jgi:hypothetical protein
MYFQSVWSNAANHHKIRPFPTSKKTIIGYQTHTTSDEDIWVFANQLLQMKQKTFA